MAQYPNINIHSVKSIKVERVRKNAASGYTRHVLITDEDGNEFDFALFGNSVNDLLVIAEPVTIDVDKGVEVDTDA